MPELAEVEFYRKRWHLAAHGSRVREVLTHERKKLLREVDIRAFRQALLGATLVDSEARAKQMLFRFRRPGDRSQAGDVWLGIHLGMSGELSTATVEREPGKHDHLVLRMEREKTPRAKSAADAPATSVALVFNDPRMFGRVLFHLGREAPAWWTKIAPAILSRAFTTSAVADFLQRRRRAPIKAVLLMQERFPGVGNWMADEILWRAGIHPARPAGTLERSEVRALWRECRQVCRQALAAIAGKGHSLPRDLNVNIPRTWLFKHRWRKGGKDPRTGTPLKHATIGGRTTCWSPARQKAR